MTMPVWDGIGRNAQRFDDFKWSENERHSVKTALALTVLTLIYRRPRTCVTSSACMDALEISEQTEL